MKKRRKRVCVIGLGHFGWELATVLAKTCEVLALDRDQELVDAIADLVHQARAVDVRDEKALAQVLPEDTDEAVISMGESMEGSILCTLYLKRLGIPLVRAKALSDDHAQVLRQVGADDVIFPERETARRVASRIANPNLLDFVPLGGGFEVVEWKAPDSFADQTLSEIKLRSQYGAYVIAVHRAGGQEMEFMPGPDFRLRRGDILTLIGRDTDLARLQELAAP